MRLIESALDHWIRAADSLRESWLRRIEDDPYDDDANKWVNRHGLLGVKLLAERRQLDKSEHEAVASMTQEELEARLVAACPVCSKGAK